MAPSGFRHLVHSDWSKEPSGRWSAEARLEDGVWHAVGPGPVGPLEDFVDRLSCLGKSEPTLAGFDFPIGLPIGYGAKLGDANFLAFLSRLDIDDVFFSVAAWPEEVGIARPFYPFRPGGTLMSHLLAGHAVESVDALTRACERGTGGARPAACMFWTMGAKQVGKAALAGWRSVILPGRVAGAKLWPFDGDLAFLENCGGLTFVETYPGDAYRQLGLSFKGLSKSRIADRQRLARLLLAWTQARQIALDKALTDAVLAGFPLGTGEDDGFDAVIGLLAMIAVVEGQWPDGAPMDDAVQRWEGWILGRHPAAAQGARNADRNLRSTRSE